MNQGFLTDLPSEIIINILSRLRLRMIINCKCVCKSWLNILESPEFAKSHLSKSEPGLIFYEPDIHFKLFEFDDALDLENHDLHYNLVTKVDCLPFNDIPMWIQGSASGLLLLREMRTEPDALCICNPITREHIKLPSPTKIVRWYPAIVTYGFGVSKMTGQHKAVRIFHECTRDPETHKLLGIPKSECQVYTLGTGSWRSIPPASPPLEYDCHSIGSFLNGNLHWLVADLMGSCQISCFDLETELFSIFSPPPPLPDNRSFLGGMVVLANCLCLCDNSADDYIVIWLMKEYGVSKSWTKEFVISKSPDFAGESYEVVHPIKVFKDGDILMSWENFHLFYYSNRTKTTAMINMLELRESADIVEAMLHTSSFLSLKSFAMEIVSSF